jgi:hypothetical protein
MPEVSLGADSLRLNLAANLYLSLGEQLRRRLTAKELLAQYPFVPPGQAVLPHYIDADKNGTKRLALIRCNFSGSVGECLTELTKSVEVRREVAGFRQAIDNGGFMLVSLVFTAEKAKRLHETLKKDWYLPVRLRIAVCLQTALAEAARKNPTDSNKQPRRVKRRLRLPTEFEPTQGRTEQIRLTSSGL